MFSIVRVYLLFILLSVSSFNFGILYAQGDFVTYNEIPTAADDVVRIYENYTTNINVTSNDNGLENGIIKIYIEKYPLHGKVEVGNDFLVKYTPNRNYLGGDVFTYGVCVNGGGCDLASVFVDILDFDFKPKAVTDSIELIYGLSDGVRFDILQNDIDAFDEPFNITILTQPNNGSAFINEDYTLSPVFDYDFIGNDSLQYRMCDAEGDCDTAWVFCEILNGDINNLFIPNALSPNGDGVNDMFRLPQLMSDVQMRITIFTQWGQVVYQNENYLNNWDGKGNLGVFNGKDLEAGTYYYVLIIGDDRPPIKNYIYLSR